MAYIVNGRCVTVYILEVCFPILVTQKICMYIGNSNDNRAQY